MVVGNTLVMQMLFGGIRAKMIITALLTKMFTKVCLLKFMY